MEWERKLIKFLYDQEIATWKAENQRADELVRRVLDGENQETPEQYWRQHRVANFLTYPLVWLGGLSILIVALNYCQNK